MEKKTLKARTFTKGSPDYQGKAPSLFAIPANIYEDELERSANKEWFKQILRLEQSSRELRNRLIECSERHMRLLTSTQAVIERAKSIKQYVSKNILKVK